MEECRARSYQNRLSPIISREEDSLSSGAGLKDSTRSSSSCTTTSSTSSLTHDVVTETLRDVINLQHSAMRRIRDDAEKQKLDYVLKVTYDDMVKQCNEERLEHSKTKILLEKEREKLNFALGEVDILKQHLQREKREHDELIKSSGQRLSRESKRSDLLHQKCAQHEDLLQAKQDELDLKDNEIASLKLRLQSQKDAHKKLLADIELQHAQQEYMSKSLNKDSRR